MAKRPQLLIMEGVDAGRRFEVKDTGIRLGRSSSNDIHIPDEELSRNHCFFETAGAVGIRVTDLASANGTFVNGRMLGADPVDLRVGDVISAGTTVLKVVEEDVVRAPTSVDLGLGPVSEAAGESGQAVAAHSAPSRKRLVLIGVLTLVATAAVALVFLMPEEKPEGAVRSVDSVREEVPALQELYYERVSATSDGIFRYELTLSAGGQLTLKVDDVPVHNRHFVKSQALDAASLRELDKIVPIDGFRRLDRDYTGVMPDPPALESWTLRVLYSTGERSVSIVNATEPEEFRTIRERLEPFANNQLGVWALQHSREKLISMAKESVRLAESKYEERDVRHGNLYEAIVAYREAISDLETVNPKPDFFAKTQVALREATAEHEKRYKEQRFLADRALNLSQWEDAQKELQILIEMVPNRSDARNREASAKLMDVEKRLKGGKK